MRVNVSVKMNKANVNKIVKASMAALPQTMEALKSEVNTMAVVPKDIGDLEESVVVGVDGNRGYISYNTPYARRLYYNPQYNFRTDMNANARGRWLDPFVHGSKREWLSDTHGAFMRAHAGGVIK